MSRLSKCWLAVLEQDMATRILDDDVSDTRCVWQKGHSVFARSILLDSALGLYFILQTHIICQRLFCLFDQLPIGNRGACEN